MNSPVSTVTDIGQIFDGPHATPTRRSEGPYFLNIASLKQGRLDLAESDHVSQEDFNRWTRRVTPEPGDLLFSYETRLGDAAVMPHGVKACLGRRMALLRPDRTKVDPRFLLYYYLGPEMQQTIATNTIHGATVQRIGLATMGAWQVNLPALAEQRAIAEVLGALDDKIAANDYSIEGAKKLADAHFALAVARGSVGKRVDDIAEFHNRRRVPLSSRQREDKKGTVPYYGAAGMIDRVDGALFDGHFVLVGEDGTVIRQDGSPVVQYIWGPAWVNNHAHVLSGRTVSTELLKVALERVDVTHLVTGAVQPKISMTNLKSLRLELPEADQIPSLDSLVQSLLSLVRNLTEECRSLETMRDALLPLLMSGKVQVKDAEKIAEEAL